MELFRPTYDLTAFKKSDYRITQSAYRGAADMDFYESDIEDAISSMNPEHFYKSMTSYADSRKWQDVYYVPYRGKVIYVKFTEDMITEFALLSFKEK